MKIIASLICLPLAALTLAANQEAQDWKPADMGILEGGCAPADYFVNELRSKHGIESVKFLPCKNALIAKGEDLFVFLKEGDKRPAIAFSGKAGQNGFLPSKYQLNGVDWTTAEDGRCGMRQNPQTRQLALECWVIEANTAPKTALVARLVTDRQYPPQ